MAKHGVPADRRRWMSSSGRCSPSVLILVFGPLSGAHFSPAVSLALALRGELTWRAAGPYILAQLAGV